MNDFCKYCGLCCKIIPVKDGMIIKDECLIEFNDLIKLSYTDACKINEQYVYDIQHIIGEADFYKCKYITEDNTCTKSPKPEFCQKFPSSALAIVPDECCYVGEIFLKREDLKQKVRKYKEEIIHYEALINSGDKDKASYEKIIKTLKKFINNYSVYGSQNW